MILTWPVCEKGAGAARLVRHLAYEGGVCAHRHDLRAVLDDAVIARQVMPKFVGSDIEGGRIEAVESLFKAWPFIIDDLVDEATVEDALRHLRQDAVIRQGRQRLMVRNGREHRLQRVGAAFSLLG